MPFFSVGHSDKERLEVELVGVPADPSIEGYDWIKAKVSIDVGGFRGDVGLMLCVSDIVRFLDQLKPVYHDLKGIAEFKTIEDQLYLQIEVDKLGHVTAKGFIRDDSSFGNKLNFEMQYDQTMLWHTISEIDEALFELSPTKGQQDS